jgi:2'-5' RNA ligase
MRLFIGIPLAAAVIGELAAITARLQSSGRGLRWMARESWHITLQFLGNAGAEQYGCAVARLRELHLPPTPIKIEGLSCLDRAGILLAAVRPTPELLLLQKRVSAATQLCGFIPEARPYQPHITLARSQGKGQRHDLRELQAKLRRPPHFTSFAAGEFLLYESFLAPSGSRYEIRARVPLGRPSSL